MIVLKEGFFDAEVYESGVMVGLKEKTAGTWPCLRAVVGAALSRSTPANFQPYLDRMSLQKPRTRQEWLWQRLLVRELRTTI